MKPEYVVYVLTALAAVVVVLTRLRLRRDSVAGRHEVGAGIVNLHTGLGTVALVAWVVYLLTEDDLVGIGALACWWVTTLAGLLILLRWLPTRGRHASSSRDDNWSAGPGLSVLAHVGLLAGVLVFTWYYASR